MDVHGAMMAQVEVANQVAIISMAWSCEKFKMEESDDNSNGSLSNYFKFHNPFKILYAYDMAA